ncbi:hypothetical protein BKM67_02945 [Streptococcus suis]|uniref:Uncharacterized protein n=1 Tax=Streptococcus suis TaxID=1307 RepID=A0AAD0KVM0_STRSU|nr:hypothetical protein BKM66_02660 [Streptococcus suis]AWX97035.1 hypothetical protein BKM67_02945 [Streptococcus suis]
MENPIVSTFLRCAVGFFLCFGANKGQKHFASKEGEVLYSMKIKSSPGNEAEDRTLLLSYFKVTG